VADNPSDQSNAPPDLGQGGVSQEDIDAIINEAGGDPAGTEPTGSPSAPDPPAEPAEISQADIDALVGGGGAAGEEPAATGAAAEPSPADATGVSQADIDALLNAATGDAGAPEGGTSAEAGSSEPSQDARVDTLGRPFDEAAAMQAAIEADQDTTQESDAPPDVKPYQAQEFGDAAGVSVDPKRVTMLNDVKLGVRIQLGRTRMLVEDVLKLDEGSVVELDKLAGDPVDVLVNDRLIARGEVLVLNDSFCIRISEVLSHDPHRITE